MSLAYVRNHLLGPIQEILAENAKTRVEVQKTFGQLFILTEAHIQKIHFDYGLNLEEHNSVYNWFLGELRTETSKVRTKSPDRYQDLLSIITHKGMKDTFIVSDHNSLSSIKKKWAEKISALTGQDSKSIDGSNNKTGWQLGHGDAGYAVSSMTAIRGLGVLARSDKFLKGTESAQSEVESLRANVLAEYLKIISSEPISIDSSIKAEVESDLWVDAKGTLRKTNTYVLTFQSALENQQAAPAERAALDKVRKYIEKQYIGAHNILKEHGGGTAEEALEGVIDYVISKSVKKVKVASKGKSSYKHNHKASSTVKRKISAQVSSVSASKAKTVATPKSSVNIVSLLNSKLPDEIRKRMTYPRLRYRTGRFSQSVKVLAQNDLKTGTSFSYTYQKDPYQLFEPGRSRLATPDRNPRNIIDESIRSIAAKQMAGRFFTRRV